MAISNFGSDDSILVTSETYGRGVNKIDIRLDTQFNLSQNYTAQNFVKLELAGTNMDESSIVYTYQTVVLDNIVTSDYFNAENYLNTPEVAVAIIAEFNKLPFGDIYLV